MERSGRSVCYRSAGSGPVLHSYKTGRHTKKLAGEEQIHKSPFVLGGVMGNLFQLNVPFFFLVCVSGTLDRSSEEDLRDPERHQAAEAVRLGEHLL